jgi:predicted choloylglycine hydrolase
MFTDSMELHGIREERPGARWHALFDAVWPAYRQWYLSEGRAARPSLAEATGRLRRHMPELVPTYERLAELAGDELAATMLTLWNPPKFLPGCSQAVLSGPTPMLVRNYDYSPELFERVVYSTRFDRRRVIGTSDCLWGLLDGMNDSGLVVSLAFGGRPGSGPGFAVPLVLRYLLETADTVPEAKAQLLGLPVSMSYNVTMIDRNGEVATVFVAPGQAPEFSAAAVATNHRGRRPEHPEHARRFRSVERQNALEAALAADGSEEDLVQHFLRPPLHSTAYDEAFGTLYTAIYRPGDGTLEYRWPGDRWLRDFAAPNEIKIVALRSDEPRVADQWAAAGDEVAGDSVADLAGQAQRAIGGLSRHGDEAAFGALLGLYETLGVALAESARSVAEAGSWSRVAGVAGVSRQAAWYRWRA